MKLARIKRVTAVARLRGRSTREARRVGVPATDTVPVERAPTPTLSRLRYGRHAFDSGEFHFLVLLSRIPCRNFRDSTRLAAVIPYRLDDGQEDDDAV